MTNASSQDKKPSFLTEIEEFHKREAFRLLKQIYNEVSQVWTDTFGTDEERKKNDFLDYFKSSKPEKQIEEDDRFDDEVYRYIVGGINQSISDYKESNEGESDIPDFEDVFGNMIPQETDPEVMDEVFSDLKKESDQDHEGGEDEKSPEEIERELISEYLERTDRKSALDTLRMNIETAQQGFSQVWKTGFSALDEKLNGGFHPKRLILIGAISSLGKTSLALQIADNVARSGRDVLIFSLEMDSDELLSKSISRETHLLSCGNTVKEKYRVTSQDILNGNIGKIGESKRELFDQALESTKQLNEHLFYFIGENDVDVETIRAVVEIHKKARNQAPLVVVDYLQILQTSDEALKRRLDKRTMTDDDVTKLRVLARDLEIPVLVLSSFNRDSYLRPVTTSSFKESSGIEYSSDILLGMQYTNMDYKKVYFTDKNGKKKSGYEGKQAHETRVRLLFDKMDKEKVRPLELKILKNRHGEKGSIFLNFNAPFNYFEETGTEDRRPKDFEIYVKNELTEDDNPFDQEENDDVIEVI